tara:strand:+ start:121 stop:438 length:318 start_codon:yes stop_codon:yes gene_type:complete
MIIDIIGYVLIAFGAFFVLSGAVGVVRMPDFFTRLHPAGVIDGIGAPLLFLGLACLHGWSLFSGKLILLVIFLLITAPTATHVLAKTAAFSGYPIKNDSNKRKHR